MRQLLQNVIVTACVLGSPCILFAHGADHGRGMLPHTAPMHSVSNSPLKNIAPSLPSMPQAGMAAMPPCAEWRTPPVPLQRGEQQAEKRALTKEKNIGLKQWLAQLSPEQRQQATLILQDASPVIRDIKHQMDQKMHQLEALTFCRETDPQALPALGQELQELRSRLKEEISTVNRRLQKTVGHPLPEPRGRGYSAIAKIVPE
ncbi:MAG: periplasmic heavy metal sensor [Desulfovibrionaceae bacterium]|nr:periplasmic heavy metal sensor [Desulfovibrionaceae bacterium]